MFVNCVTNSRTSLCGGKCDIHTRPLKSGVNGELSPSVPVS